MGNFIAIQEHLDVINETTDKQEWLQILAGHIAMIFYADVNEYNEIHKSYVSKSQLDKILSQTEITIESRLVVLELLSAMNKLLRTYAMDDKYKDINITVKSMEVDVPTQSTIQELSEHLNEWFKAYNNRNKNAKRVAPDEVAVQISNKTSKSKKAVRFATQARVYRTFVDDDGYKVDQSLELQKFKFISKPKATKTKKRRASTVVKSKPDKEQQSRFPRPRGY